MFNFIFTLLHFHLHPSPLLQASAPPIYGNTNGVLCDQNGAPPGASQQMENTSTQDVVVVAQPQPHCHYPDQTSCVTCGINGQQRLTAQQQQIMYAAAAAAADNCYYQQAATTRQQQQQQQQQFYNAQQQQQQQHRTGLQPMYEGGYCLAPLMSAPVSPQQTQQQQQQLWRLQNAAAARE